MAVGERSRRELQEALMEAIGPDPTDTLFGYLPPAGWADVASTRDVAALGVALRGEMAALGGMLRGEMAELRVEMHHELRVQFYWLVTLQLTILTILLTVLATGLLG